MRPVVITTSLELASSPEDVWGMLTQTDRVGRRVSNKIEFNPFDDPSSPARFLAETSALGFKLVYEDAPYEWSYLKHFRVHRRARQGVVRWYSYGWSLEPANAKGGPGAGGLEQGTRATLHMEMVARSALFYPLVWIGAHRFAKQLVDLARQADAHVHEGAPSPFREPASEVAIEQLARALTELKRAGVDEPLAERIGGLLRDASDADLARVRPFELADQWGVDRRSVLQAFLRSVPAGLFELRWAVVCPSCLTASEQYRALDQISLEGHCQMCDISFELDLDRAVEAVFVPHASVRSVGEQLFCVSGPSRTPHVLVQTNFDKGASQRMEAPSKPGRYRIFARGGASATVEVDEGAAAEADVTVDATGVHPARVVVQPGGGLKVTNADDVARHMKIERLEYASAAATAHLVSTIGEFRQLFSSELLKRGTPLKVARVAIVFSDLTGSTALYTKVGDASAFRLVDDHFDVLRAIIDRRHGVFVKTMGDAMLAAFTDAREATLASIDALGAFEEFRAKEKHGELVGLKLGMYAGACYVVTANGALDYFGQTVNVASRVQHLAESGELILPRAQFEALTPQERAVVVVKEEFQARVKGVDEMLDLVRLGLPTASPSRSSRSGA